MARFPTNGVYLDGTGNIVKGGTVVIYEFLSSDPSNPTVVATFYENKSGGNAVTSLTTDLNGVYLAWLDSIDYDGTQIFTLITSKSTHTDVPFHFTLPGLVSVSQNVTAALDNLASVAINTSLVSDTDATDDLGTGDIRWNNGYIANLRSGLTANDTLILQGRDVNGSSWQDVLKITSADTVLADLWAAVTIGGNAILNAGTDVTVPQGGSGRGAATAYAVLCGGTTSTAAHQSLAAVGTSGQILTSNGAGALPTFQAAAGGGLEAGTKVLFKQATAPTGWTIDDTITDKSAVRYTRGASYGADAGSVNLATGVSVTQGHALSTAELAVHSHSHSHTMSMHDNGSHTTGQGRAQSTNNAEGHTQATSVNATNAGSGNTHNHSIELRYTDIIVATKD